MLRTIAELKSVIDKWVGNLHLDPQIPHDIAIAMCEQFIAFLKTDKEAKLKAQQEQARESPKEVENV